MPPWLVALLVAVPCSAFPRVSRLTNEEIHQHVEKKGWAKTRVDKPEECDREKCPKMMDICPEGGHCYVTGDCGDDGCLCNIKIACQEKNDKESENQETNGNKIQPDKESENEETSISQFQPEVGSDYSDDDHDDEHHDDEHHNEAKQGHQNLKHTSCLKNIHNESYCQGWKEATCDKKNMQACCDQAEWSRDWKTSCGAKIGTCEDYRIQHDDGSCCWRLTCPSKEGHDYMESSNEKPHRYEDKVEEQNEEEEEEHKEEKQEEDEVEGDEKEVSEGDDEDESEGDVEKSEEVEESEEEVVIEEEEVSESVSEEDEEEGEDEGEENIDEGEGDVDEGEGKNEGKEDNEE